MVDELISLMDTGFDVPGTTAKFCTPVIPGPEIKKAKTSLNEKTNSGYSSEAKT